MGRKTLLFLFAALSTAHGQVDSDAVRELTRKAEELARKAQIQVDFDHVKQFSLEAGELAAQVEAKIATLHLGAPMFLAQGRGRDGRNEEAYYERGQRALERRRWDEAVEHFSEVISRGGGRAEGALYWKAYALHKLGRRDEALASLAELRKSHANSRWGDDAKALEVEIRQAAGRPVTPESEGDEELKLIALNGLVQSDAERAVPLIEKLLKGSQSPKLKERALFVLAQSGSPKARAMLADIAKGGSNPDLQVKALHYLGVNSSAENRQLLGEIYAASNDAGVKRAILRSFMASGDRDRLLQAARNEKTPELRVEAIRYLGARGAHDELWQIYQSEQSSEIKEAILRSMHSSGNTERLLHIARSETDPKLRRQAIQSLEGMGHRSGDALVSLYASEADHENRKHILNALAGQDNAKALIEIARKETNPELRRNIVQRLSHMRSKEATDYLMELLNK